MRVAIDGDAEYLGAYVAESVSADRWNGWARPLFSLEVARAIVARFPGLSWSADGSTVLDAGSDGEYADAPEEWRAVSGRMADGSIGPLYAIGAGSWVWLELEGSTDEEEM